MADGALIVVGKRGDVERKSFAGEEVLDLEFWNRIWHSFVTMR